MDALYELDGDRVLPTELTRGPWDPRHQHAGPPSALLARAIEAVAGIEGGQVARIGFDILRPVPIAPLRVQARVLRPGRRVEQLEAVLSDEDGAELMRARAWRMRSEAVPLPDGLAAPEPAPPAPAGLPVSARPSFFRHAPAYADALEWRFFAGDFERAGPAGCWTRLLVPLVAGEPPRPLERLLVMADAASGISATLDWTRWVFINVDFNLHLERPPEGDWMAMDAVTRPGERGAGLCTSVLSDARGRLGISTQSLLVGPR
jgi:hypothetical protein